jgi:hypothetical protein
VAVGGDNYGPINTGIIINIHGDDIQRQREASRVILAATLLAPPLDPARKKAVAGYYRRIAKTLTETAKGLRAGTIPHSRCGEMLGYAHELPAALGDVIGQEQAKALLDRRLFRWATAFLLLIIRPPICLGRWCNVAASERGQGRAAPFADRRREPLTPCRGRYARKWLWARHLGAHSLTTKASLWKIDRADSPGHLLSASAGENIRDGRRNPSRIYGGGRRWNYVSRNRRSPTSCSSPTASSTPATSSAI